MPERVRRRVSRFCLDTPAGDISFATFDRNGQRTVLSPGHADDVLERSEAVPPAQSLRCSGASSSSADATSLRAALWDLSTRGPALDASRVSLFQAVNEYGASATVHSLPLAALDSLAANRTLFSPRLLLWSNPSRCDRSDMSCFFAALPSVADLYQLPTETRSRQGKGRTPASRSITSIPSNGWKRLLDTWYGPRSAFGVLEGPSQAASSLDALSRAMKPRLAASKHRTAALCRRLSITCPRLLPVHFAASVREAEVFNRLPQQWLRHGRFWLISQVLHFLTQPNAVLRRVLARARAQLRFDDHQPVLALHVRKGDACKHRGECRGLNAFMPHVQRMLSAYSYRSVFLATPSMDVILETARYPNITWLYVNRTSRRATNAQSALDSNRLVRLEDGLLRRDLLDPVLEWQDTLVDIYLMAESQGLVGAFSSSAARLAYSLMSAGPTGCAKPFISVDINWCFAYMRGGPDVIRRDGAPATAMITRSAGALTC